MSMAIKYAMKKKMAKGGEAGVHAPHKSSVGGGKGESEAGDHTRWAQAERTSGNAGQASARNMMAKRSHQKVLGELHSMKGKDRTNLADGGEVKPDDDDDDSTDESAFVNASYAKGDMVDKIMAKRMAKGGDVTADAESNDFDVLDEMGEHHEADYTGANSGDGFGNAEMDENDRDLISRIMRSRAKKDSMPRPA